MRVVAEVRLVSTLADFVAKVTEFNQDFRGPTVREIKVYGPFATRDLETRAGDMKDDWRAIYHCDQPGVYCFLDAGRDVYYIGKASGRRTIAGRFMRHRKYHLGKGDWSRWKATQHAQFVPVPVEREHPFMACALEEYLIDALQPPGNRQGRRRGATRGR